MLKKRLYMYKIRFKLFFKILFGFGSPCIMCGSVSNVGVIIFNEEYHLKCFCNRCYDYCLSNAFFRYIININKLEKKIQLLKMIAYDTDYLDNIQHDDFVDVIKKL